MTQFFDFPVTGIQGEPDHGAFAGDRQTQHQCGEDVAFARQKHAIGPAQVGQDVVHVLGVGEPCGARAREIAARCPGSAATTSTTISVTLAPRARIEVKAA